MRMKIDVVYVLGKGSIWNDNELRCSLRSIEKYLKNYARVWIVGECPEWVQNVTHVPCEDVGVWSDRNIMEKILRACSEPEISEEFLFFNDDHFLLAEFDAFTFPFFTDGDLQRKIDRRKNNGRSDHYRYTLENTQNALKKKNLPTKNFDVHTPIRYRKKDFAECMKGFDWTVDYAYVIKSLYSNSREINGEHFVDMKLVGPMKAEDIHDAIRERKIFSVGDGAFSGQMNVVLFELYPDKSKFEK